MHTPDLLSLYEQIDPPDPSSEQSVRYAARVMPGLEQYRVAKDAAQNPSLLIAVPGLTEQPFLFPVVLEHLRVQFNVTCRVLHSDGLIDEGRFTVLTCIDADDTLRAYFLRVAALLIASCGSTPTEQSLLHGVAALVELFAALSRPPRDTIQGLWAELFLISQARDPATLVRAWHVEPNDLFDFSATDQRIEVKSTSGSTRRHTFALEQARPPEGVSVLVASLRTIRVGAGASIEDVIKTIRRRLGGDFDLMLRVEQLVAVTLGNSLSATSDEHFDLEIARQSLAFYEAYTIPSVDPSLPDGVCKVRFEADLTRVPSLELAALRSSGGIFQAVLR